MAITSAAMVLPVPLGPESSTEMPRPRGCFAREAVRAIDQRAVAHLRRRGLEIVDHIGRQHDVVPGVAGHDAVGQFVEFAARPLAAGLPQIAAVGRCGGDGARSELELLRDGRDRLMNLRRMRPQRVVPELHAVLGIERIESAAPASRRESRAVPRRWR